MCARWIFRFAAILGPARPVSERASAVPARRAREAGKTTTPDGDAFSRRPRPALEARSPAGRAIPVPATPDRRAVTTDVGGAGGHELADQHGDASLDRVRTRWRRSGAGDGRTRRTRAVSGHEARQQGLDRRIEVASTPGVKVDRYRRGVRRPLIPGARSPGHRLGRGDGSPVDTGQKEAKFDRSWGRIGKTRTASFRLP